MSSFGSASDESDDEKFLEERLRQFERLNAVNVSGSEDNEFVEDDEDEEQQDTTYRPIKNKYGGIDEKHLDVDDDDEDDEPSAAILEEREAKAIQKRLANLVSDKDINLDLLGVKSSLAEERLDGELQGFEVITSDSSKEEMLDYVDKRYPEIEPLVCKIKEATECLEKKYIPLVKMLDSDLSLQESVGHAAVMFVRAKQLLSFTYCINAIFYLRLRANQENVEGHPVTVRLVSCQKLLQQLEKTERFYMKKGKRLDMILKAHEEGLSGDELILLARKQFPETLPESSISNRRPVEDDETAKNGDNIEELVETDIDKRKLNDKMEGKAGAPRSKSKRNPRVANRNRFAKALKRRKAAGVREWQPPVEAYGGELTGIRAGLRRSTKLKM